MNRIAPGLFFTFALAASAVAEPRIELPADSFMVGKPVPVTFSGLPGNSGDWVAISRADQADNQYVSYRYTSGVKEGNWELKAGPPGDYEVRIYLNWPAGGYNPVLRRSFKIVSMEEAAEAGLISKPEIQLPARNFSPGQPIEVTVTGLPGNPKDWVSIALVGSADNQYRDYDYSNGVNEGTWTYTIHTPGDYEIRVYLNWPAGGYNPVVRERISVGAEQRAASAENGSATQAPRSPTARSAPAAVPIGMSQRCTPQALGKSYETNVGRLECRANEKGMNCRRAGAEIDGCGLFIDLELRKDGKALVGQIFENGRTFESNFPLDTNCNLYQASWRDPSGRPGRFEAKTVPPGAARETSQSNCTIETLARDYALLDSEFKCRVNGSRFDCCASQGDQDPLGMFTQALGLDCTRFLGLRLEMDGDGSAMVGRMMTPKSYETVRIPLDEKCRLNGGMRAACGTPNSQAEPLNMIFDARRAPDRSSPEGQNEIGLYYLAMKRPVDALPHFSTAADAGIAEAQFQFAVLLENGAGDAEAVRNRNIDQDVDRATALYAAAARQGHAKAKQNLERREQQAASLEQLTENARRGDAAAQYQLSRLYALGKLVDFDVDRQFEWLAKAAENDHPAALRDYGVMHRLGFDGSDAALGLRYLERSAELGNEWAYLELGLIAFNEGDSEQAEQWLQKAEQSDNEVIARQARSTLDYLRGIIAEREFREWLKTPEGRRYLAELERQAEESRRQLRASAAHGDNLDAMAGL